MVKEFQLLITPPPWGVFVSDISGRVLVVTEEAKQGYKSIQVTLRGLQTYAGVSHQVLVRIEQQSPTILTTAMHPQEQLCKIKETPSLTRNAAWFI